MQNHFPLGVGGTTKKPALASSLRCAMDSGDIEEVGTRYMVMTWIRLRKFGLSCLTPKTI
jgi:hypothetical protein